MHEIMLRKCSFSLRSIFKLLSLVLVLAISALSASAQSTQGTIVGTVKDANGSLVPGANVTLTNTDEGTVRTTVANGSGEYQFSDAKAAHYSLLIEAPGFEKWETTGVVLTVRQQLRLDAKLSVGAVQQEVTVNGDSVSAIETESPTISGVFTSDDAINLPVNTRASFSGTSADAILGALPGVQVDSDSSGISLQGALPYQVDITVDGITLKNPGGGTQMSNSYPSSEAISEIRADGALNGAEYGDPGQVVVTTKGGTNKFHGSAFWYYQSSAFDAIAYTRPTTTTKPSVHGDTFGGSLGGPVDIPHLYHGNNKSFFFVDYEGWRHPAQTTAFAVVPSTLMKQGDFSKYVEPDGKGGNSFTGLIDPFTGQNIGKVLPAGLINGIATDTLTTFYPDPNIGDPTAYTDDGTPNWQKNVNQSAHSDQYDIRGDQYFGSNQKFLLWGKYSYKNLPSSSYKFLDLPSDVNTGVSRVFKIDGNYSFTPSLIDEASFGFARVESGSENSFDGKAWTTAAGFVGLQNLFYNGIPEMDFNNIQSLNADRLSNPSKSYTFDYTDTLIWTKGNHTMKFGFNAQHLEAYSTLGFNGSDNYGTYQFNTSNSTGKFTGLDFGDFLLGLPNQTFYDVVSQDNDGVSNHYHAFAQDEWRVNPRLTLSYGVRYELHPGYYDKGGDIGNFDPSVPLSGAAIYPDGKQNLLAQAFLASANACDPDGVTATNDAVVNGAPCMQVKNYSQAGLPQGLKKYPHLRFMPRIGFAFRPFNNDKWAIRGGYGIYNINMLGSSFYSLTGTLQASTTQYTNSYDATTHTVGYQWPNIYAGAGNGGCTTCYGTDYFGTANSVNWKDPYTEQWSLSIDHDLGAGYAARASYIGSGTRHLVWAPDENTLPFSSTVSAFNAPITSRLYPNWGRINTRDTGADSSYESLQLEFSHRLQHGLEFHSTYTLAKALANNEGPNNSGFAGEGGGARATTILNRNEDFGNVFGTRRNRWNTTALYDLPFGRGRTFGGSMNRFADLAVGGWRLSSIFTWQSGAFETPYFPDGEMDPSGTGSGLDGAAGGFDLGHRNQHADQVARVNTKPSGQNRFNWINQAAFACPGNPTWTVGTACTTGDGQPGNPYANPIGRFGNSQVGTVVGPGLVNLSSGLSKSFSITERIKLKAEGTFTNVLNHTNLGDPNTNLSSPTYGIISTSAGADFGGARTGQVSARLEF
jgi:hypothetical protein